MEQNTPKFRLRLNLFDGIVLVLALAVAAFLVWTALKPAAPVQADPTVQDTVRYTVRFRRWASGTSVLIQPGDQIADNIKNYEIGQVVSAEAVPALVQVLDHDNRRIVWAELEGFEDVLVTIEAPCTVTDENTTVGGGYNLRVGAQAFLKGEGYMGSGPIVSVEQGMKMIDGNGRLFGKISVIDVLVILVVAVLAAALYFKSIQTHTGSTVTEQSIVFQIRARGVDSYVYDALREGDGLYDLDYSSGGRAIGRIAQIEVESDPGTKLADELHDGAAELVEAENTVDLLITVEGSGLVDGKTRTINRVYALGVNSSRTYYTKQAQFVGTVASIK